MRSLKPSILLLASLLTLTLATGARAITFTHDSHLASGRWVRIGVPENGVYRISYERLRELGFADPASVTVWGEGGVMYPADFVDAAGRRLIPDRMTQVAAQHTPGGLIFYGKGPENLTWQEVAEMPLPGRFANAGTNIYSNYGVYFLSDAGTPLPPEPSAATAAGGAAPLTSGFSYFRHEVDITQGLAHSGQDFWGEEFLAPQDRGRTFAYQAPGALPGAGAILNVRFNGLSWLRSTLNITLDESAVGSSTIDARPSDGYYLVKENNRQMFPLPGGVAPSGTVGLTWVPSATADTHEARLDYILLTYTRAIAFADGESQFGVSPLVTAGQRVRFPDGTAVTGWDITDPSRPSVLQPDASGAAPLESGLRTLVFFSAGAALKTPVVLGEAPNADLRRTSLLANPEFVIITTEAFRARAEQLADFHRTHDGTPTLVVTVSELYNEFSAGRPDPMAYRAFLKMLAEASGSRLSTLLLYGPMSSDVRGLNGSEAQESVIVYQNPSGAHITDCVALVDIYGMLGDTMRKYVSTEQMQLAVGVLPVGSDAEAARYFDKLSRYYLDESRPYWMDRSAYIADDKDNGSHMLQCENLIREMSGYSGGSLVADKIYFGDYGYPNVKNRIHATFNEGCVMTSYIGHASTQSLGFVKPILKPSDVQAFRNSRLGFMNFASCETSLYELGVRGVAGHLLLSTDAGIVGAHGTVRTSYSGDNYAYMRNFQQMLWRLPDPATGLPATIGEVVRRSKNATTGYVGKFKFHLICDPMLRLPLPTMLVEASPADNVAAGTTLRLQGRVCTPDGSGAPSFNGRAVVKWYAPAYSANAQAKVSNEKPPFGTTVRFESEVVALQAFEVVNGRFDIAALCPASMEGYAGDSVLLTLTVYDPERRVGGNLTTRVLVSAPQAGSEPGADTLAPVVEEIFAEGADGNALPASFTLCATATDNEGLRLDERSFDAPLSLTVDGRAVEGGVASFITMADAGRRLSLRYPLADLTPGRHSAILTVSDYRGNRTRREFIFETGAGAALAAPSLAEGACRTTATLVYDRGGASDLRVVITDPSGREIFSAEAPADSFVWNLRDNSGARVAPGLYKAWLRYSDSRGRAAVSSAAYLPVLAPGNTY